MALLQPVVYYVSMQCGAWQQAMQLLQAWVMASIQAALLSLAAPLHSEHTSTSQGLQHISWLMPACNFHDDMLDRRNAIIQP